jgi:hypothetical protein
METNRGESTGIHAADNRRSIITMLVFAVNIGAIVVA